MTLANDPEIIDLAQQMADLTRPRCGGKGCGYNGRRKNFCCEKFYCDVAEEYALMHGVTDIPKPGPVDLPYMASDGRCVMPPHLRLVCTVHDCQINSWGFDPEDKEFTDKYFDLRERLSAKLHEVDSKS